MQVKIIPKCQRAKNRVREHGSIMHHVRDEGNRSLFESLDKTFSLSNGIKIKWSGWFTKEEASKNNITP